MDFIKNNKNTFPICLILASLFGGMELNAQTSLVGKVVDSKSREELIRTKIMITKNGNLIQNKLTDQNGNFKINIDPGEYEVVAVFIGYPSVKIEDVIAIQDQNTVVNIELEKWDENIFCGGGPVYITHRKLIFQKDMTTIGKTITTEESKFMSSEKIQTRNLEEIFIQIPGVSWQQ